MNVNSGNVLTSLIPAASQNYVFKRTVFLPCARLVALSLVALCLATPALALAAQPEIIATSTETSKDSQQAAIRSNREVEKNLFILRLQLDGSILSDGLIAYQDGSQILLPLGEIARLLTLAITVNPEAGNASGYFLSEDRTFALNVAQSLVSISGNQERFQEFGARVIDGDIYITTDLLSRWFPINFVINMSALQLDIKPREKLPLQERLERMRTAARLGSIGEKQTDDPGYPRVLEPYKLINRPFIDQTFGSTLSATSGSQQTKTASTTYITADFLGMEGSAFVSSNTDKSKPELRLTLGRNDPDAGLLGPLRARSVLLGNIAVPSVANVMNSSGTGIGLAVSNRALDLPTSFDRQRLRGELPPDWDVTLYYNDALLSFQASRADGLYSFDDLPLSFGRNEFQLVFNGPLGQLRIEHKSFLLDQSIVKPGELLYSLTQQLTDNGETRSVAQFDFGLTKKLVGSAGFIRAPRPVAGQSIARESSYTQLGLRAYLDAGILTSELTFAQSGGMLAQLGFKTQLGTYAVDMRHTQLQGNFDSEVFSAGSDPVVQQNELRISGSIAPGNLPPMPVSLDAIRVVQKSGASREAVSARLSMILGTTSLTNGLIWQRSGLISSIAGNLQLNQRIADLGINGQLTYNLKPNANFESLGLNVDRNLSERYRVNAGLLRTFSSGGSLVSAGLSRDFGGFALAISSSYSSQRTLAVAFQLFVALGHKPSTHEWFVEPLPMANTGAVAVRVFVDKNLDGIYRPGEELIPNAGFIINSGGRHPARTAADGTAFIGKLAPGSYTDIALDPSTLEDPLWQPVIKGVRVLPRPGLVQMLEFAVVSTSEIDGTVYLAGKDNKRGIGDALVELVDNQGVVIKSTQSSSDGFYLLTRVMPGSYTLRISPAQVSELKLFTPLERSIKVLPEGDFISGQDLEVKKRQP